MEKGTFLFEVLYIVSNYEKGKIPIKRWSNKYINSLHDSLVFMGNIITMIKTHNQKEEFKIESICEYLCKKEMIKFSNIPTKGFLCEDDFSIDSFGQEGKELLNLMQVIIFECDHLLKTKTNNYKKRITYLLMAFHNIPKVFLKNEKSAYFDICILPISIDDAKESVDTYIKLSKMCM